MQTSTTSQKFVIKRFCSSITIIFIFLFFSIVSLSSFGNHPDLVLKKHFYMFQIKAVLLKFLFLNE